MNFGFGRNRKAVLRTSVAMPDIAAPGLSNPTSAQTGQNSASLTVGTTEGNGTLYWFVSANASAPTAANLMAGIGATAAGSAAVTSAGTKTFPVTGLAASTAYYAYFLHRDAAGNNSAVLPAGSFTTASSSGTLFTAETIPTANRVGFYDLTDAASVTAPGGVHQTVTDKFGILPALNMADAALRPVWSATGLDGAVAGSDFTNDRLTWTSATALANALDGGSDGPADLAVFIFGKYKGGHTNDGRLVSIAAAAGNDHGYPGFMVAVSPANEVFVYSAGTPAASAAIPVGSPVIIGANFAPDGWIQINGTEAVSFAGAVTPLDECGRMAIGGNVQAADPPEFANFVFTHILMLKNITREQGMQIAGRWAHQHNYTSLLAAGQPYKTVAPKVTDVFTTSTVTLSKTSYPEDVAQTIAFNGVPAGATLAYVSGTFPPGLNFDGTAYTLAGTSPDIGSYTFTVRLTAAGAVNSKLFTFTMSVLPGGTANQWVGVNLAGAEFGHGELSNVPGAFTGGTTQYVYADDNTIGYFTDGGTGFVGKDMKIIRFPVLWERLQKTVGGPLDGADLAELDRVVARTTGAGRVLCIDLHNYMRRWMGNELRIIANNTTDPVLHRAHLASFWALLADRYKGNSLVWFNLMNEPHDMGNKMPNGVDVDHAADNAHIVGVQNACITAIRGPAGGNAQNKILVGSNYYSGMRHFRNGNTGFTDAYLLIYDPANNWALDLHQYSDDNYSGNDADLTPVPNEGTPAALTTATCEWLRANGIKAFIGELGGAANADYEALLRGQMTVLRANADVIIGWAWWAAGPWWDNYSYSIQPGGSAPNYTDKPQTAWVTDYMPAGTVTEPTDTTPNTFTFAPVNNVNVSTPVESVEQQIGGLAGATAISVSAGGEWAKRTATGTYGAWQTAAGTITNTDFAKVRQTTSSVYNTATSIQLTIGTLTRTFTATTVEEAIVPSNFVATGFFASEEDATYKWFDYAHGSAINVTTAGEAKYLVADGGAAGGIGWYDAGGGGGGGGVKWAVHNFAVGNYAVTVGTGGSPGPDGGTPTAGNPSSITGVYSGTGGGVGNSGNGASGGGGVGNTVDNVGGTGVAGIGFPGGSGAGGGQGNQRSGGGGGGAGGPGGNATQAEAGVGGPGRTIGGRTYGAGGGGARAGNRSGALGGSGIGGKGGNVGDPATAGAAGTGSGGGGTAAEGNSAVRPGGGGSGAVRIRVTKPVAGGGSVPANTTAPAITGTAQDGSTLTVSNGVWANSPTGYSYQWKRGATNVGTNAATYTLVTADVGSTMTCVVTATNATGSAAATSAATGTVAAAAGGSAPTNTTAPAITGTAQEGSTLTVSNGAWTGTPTGYAYQWKRDGQNVGGNANTFGLTSFDVGKVMTCVVTATNATGSTAATSAATTTVVAAAAGGTAVPVVTGSTGLSSPGDVVLTLPALAANNLILIFAESADEVITAPTGFTQIQQGGTNNGVLGSTNGVTRLALFAKRAVGNETTVTIPDAGNHCTAAAIVISGVSWDTNPWEASAIATVATLSTAVSAPSVTTLGANRLVICGYSHSRPDVNPYGSGYTNANLTNLVEVADLGTATGNGGGLFVAAGTKAAAGATGATTATTVATTGCASITVAIKA